MPMPEKETGPWPAPCPNCGESASVRFSDQGNVEVSCPNCGEFEVAQEIFDHSQADIVDTDEP